VIIKQNILLDFHRSFILCLLPNGIIASFGRNYTESAVENIRFFLKNFFPVPCLLWLIICRHKHTRKIDVLNILKVKNREYM